MNYKNILVHLDCSARAQVRLEIALQLARRFGAHLTGLFSVYTPERDAFYVMAGSAAYFNEVTHLRRERRGAIERLFHAELERAQVPGKWLVATERANWAVPRYARYADLVVAGQHNPDDPESFVDDEFEETLVLASGCPVLLIPHAGSFAHVGRHPLVAWNASREAARAVHDAIPFFSLAAQTTVLVINGSRRRGDGPALPDASIATALSHYSAHVELSEMQADSSTSVGNELLSRAADFSADLIVMGGYGHSRWNELIVGGTTRTILRSMTVPILMSH